MIEPLPDPGSSPPRQEPKYRWSIVDLVIFTVFFAVILVALPLAWRLIHPSTSLTSLTAFDQVVVQGVMDLALVGFICFLVKVVHRESFVETVHWRQNRRFGTVALISLGATLAITVLIVSSYFPAAEPPPIEKVLSSTQSIYLFALFGITLAPISEEIIIRGFVYKVLSDVGGSLLAVTGSALVFATLHVPQLWGSWAGVLLIFLVGYVLSFVRHRADSLIPSVIIHTSYNSMLFAVFALSTFIQKGTH